MRLDVIPLGPVNRARTHRVATSENECACDAPSERSPDARNWLMDHFGRVERKLAVVDVVDRRILKDLKDGRSSRRGIQREVQATDRYLSARGIVWCRSSGAVGRDSDPRRRDDHLCAESSSLRCYCAIPADAEAQRNERRIVVKVRFFGVGDRGIWEWISDRVSCDVVAGSDILPDRKRATPPEDVKPPYLPIHVNLRDGDDNI